MSREGLRILVVDDEPDICWVVQNALRPLGCVVEAATSGTDALDLLASEPYAVALVDAKLPDFDGATLAAAIRRETPDTMVILVSGYYHSADRAVVEGLREGLFAGFVSKPFDLDEIRQAARQALGRR